MCGRSTITSAFAVWPIYQERDSCTNPAQDCIWVFFAGIFNIYLGGIDLKEYLESTNEVLQAAESSREGLSTEQVRHRVQKYGKNILAESEKDSLIKQFFSQLAEPMTIILLAAALISGVIAAIEGDSFADVIIILTVVIVNAVLGVYQENKAERAIEALQQMAASTSRVYRDGNLCVVKSEELTIGDIVALEAGDSIPADGRIIESASLKIEEAALTGESVPVQKTAETIVAEGDVPLGDRKNMAYMGSTVVYGRGLMVVTAIGMNTEMGKIAGALSKAEDGQTPLQIRLTQLSKILTKLVLGICAVIFAVQIIRAGGFTATVAINSFMVAVSLAVAAIPEGLSAVVTVVLSIGVTNMSKRSAIIRKLTAVETLGCAQIICSDKTGTLTQNKMTVTEYAGGDESATALAMALCSDAEVDDSGEVTGEPTEAALVAWAYKLGLNKNKLKTDLPRVGEAPFDSERKMMSTVHAKPDGGFVQYTKGAPDELLMKCSHYLSGGSILPLTDEARRNILAENKNMADRALRVLAAASRDHDQLPDNFDAQTLEHDMCFLGLCGMIDPVRPEVKAAIDQCRSAGIRPIMITGDHIDTAVAIAKELGILSEGQRAITGSQLSAMSDEEFSEVFRDISVYARVQPEHKTRIVNAWQTYGRVTAMTGDGVNDAPSIKSADIGVGMGITGTDVTKSVADMVLADDNFATIVSAVEEGRRIYDNIQKTIQFLLSSNMSEVISIFAATLMGFTVLRPVHLLWINLMTDCFPAIALGMEKAEGDVMNRKPRDASEGIFSAGMGWDIAYQGLLVAALTIASFFVGHYLESGVWGIADSPHGVTMAFITMSMAEIFHSINMRSQRGSIFSVKSFNIVLLLALLGTFAATAIVCGVPFISSMFGFTAVKIKEYFIATAIAFLVIPIVELVKAIQRKTTK